MKHEIDGYSLMLISDPKEVESYLLKYEFIADDPTSQKHKVIQTSAKERELGLPLTPTQKSASLGYLVSGIYVIGAVKQSKVTGQKWIWKFTKEELFFVDGKIRAVSGAVSKGKICPCCKAEIEDPQNRVQLCGTCKADARTRVVRLARTVRYLVGNEAYPIAVAHVREKIGLQGYGGGVNALTNDDAANALAYVVSNGSFRQDVLGVLEGAILA